MIRRVRQRVSRPPREVTGWKRQCLFTRSAVGCTRNRLEAGADFVWPRELKGIRLLTGSILGYHEASVIHVGVVTPAEGEVKVFEVEEIVDQVCKLIRGGCEIAICPDKAIVTRVDGKHELLVRLFRVQGLVAGFSRGEAGQDEVLTVHLRGMELSNMWYSELLGPGGTYIRGYVVSWGQIIYSYADYMKEMVQYVAVISEVGVGRWRPNEGEVNALVAGAVRALRLEQPVYSNDIMGYARSSSSSWEFRPGAKVGEVEVYYTYLEER